MYIHTIRRYYTIQRLHTHTHKAASGDMEKGFFLTGARIGRTTTITAADAAAVFVKINYDP
jgi:hypothetical protein